ncbi:MAG TPA: Spy/CpxP family protein refolding chaperone [Candidatus Binatia bacterium]|jgi:Spy/CpxP family protein refolding chaperone
MKRATQLMTAVGALAIATLMSSAIFAHPGFGPGRLGMRRMGPPLFAELQLSADQRAQIQTIFSDARDTLQPLARQLREKHAALREAAGNQPFDETAVRSQAQEIADMQAQLMVARAQVMNRVRGVLTDEQKARLSELRAQRLQQFREWRRERLGQSDPSDK